MPESTSTNSLGSNVVVTATPVAVLLICHVSPYATYGARRAVGMHYGPTRIHWADYSLHHRRDGSAGTTILYHPTILYHLRIYRGAHSLSVLTTGRRSCWSMGTAAASAGAAGPFRDYGPDGAASELSRSTPRQADDTTTRPSGAGRRVSPTTGTRSQTTCYVRRATGRWYIVR